MGRETDRRHLLVKSQCLAQFGIEISSMHIEVSTTEFGDQKIWKHQRTETVDGQNIQTLQHALCWTPAPPNLNVSARVLAKVMLGVWFFSSIGANAFQVTITLNFGGEGVVQDRRGLNISSIYGTNWGVRHGYKLGCAACRTPQPVLSGSLMFSHLLVSKLCCGNINVHAADLIPNCAKHWLFTSKCLLSVSRPIFSIP